MIFVSANTTAFKIDMKYLVHLPLSGNLLTTLLQSRDRQVIKTSNLDMSRDDVAVMSADKILKVLQRSPTMAGSFK